MAVTVASGKDPRAGDPDEDLDPAEVRKRDAETLKTLAGLLSARNKKPRA